MNWQHTRLTLSPISGAVLLTACAGAEVRPIVDMKGVNETRYEKDLAECQGYAKEASGMGSTGQGCRQGCGLLGAGSSLWWRWRCL